MSWEKLLVAIGVLAGLFVLAALLWPVLKRRAIYPGGTLSPAEADPALHGLPGSEQLWLETEDGVRIHGWWTPARGEARGAVVFCHGNAETIATRAWLADRLADRGFHALLFDYRGYGLSEGRAEDEGLARDARAAWRHVVGERGVAPNRVVLMGHSLGSAVATRLALELEAGEPGAFEPEDVPPGGREQETDSRPGPDDGAGSDEVFGPAALVIGSPFPDMPTLFRHHAPWLPESALRWPSDRHEAGSRLGEVEAPVLVLIATGDRTIPPEVSRTVYDAARGPGVELVTAPAEHGTLMGHPDAWVALDTLLNRVVSR